MEVTHDIQPNAVHPIQTKPLAMCSMLCATTPRAGYSVLSTPAVGLHSKEVGAKEAVGQRTACRNQRLEEARTLYGTCPGGKPTAGAPYAGAAAY